MKAIMLIFILASNLFLVTNAIAQLTSEQQSKLLREYTGYNAKYNALLDGYKKNFGGVPPDDSLGLQFINTKEVINDLKSDKPKYNYQHYQSSLNTHFLHYYPYEEGRYDCLLKNKNSMTTSLDLSHPDNMTINKKCNAEAQKVMAAHYKKHYKTVPGQIEPEKTAIKNDKKRILKKKLSGLIIKYTTLKDKYIKEFNSAPAELVTLINTMNSLESYIDSDPKFNAAQYQSAIDSNNASFPNWTYRYECLQKNKDKIEGDINDQDNAKIRYYCKTKAFVRVNPENTVEKERMIIMEKLADVKTKYSDLKANFTNEFKSTPTELVTLISTINQIENPLYTGTKFNTEQYQTNISGLNASYPLWAYRYNCLKEKKNDIQGDINDPKNDNIRINCKSQALAQVKEEKTQVSTGEKTEAKVSITKLKKGQKTKVKQQLTNFGKRAKKLKRHYRKRFGKSHADLETSIEQINKEKAAFNKGQIQSMDHYNVKFGEWRETFKDVNKSLKAGKKAKPKKKKRKSKGKKRKRRRG